MIKRRLLTTSARSMVSEPYRAIRTALLFSQPENPPQVVLVTSPFPGEGKTATSLNLSVALAHAGYSVLLIDADMRRGCCHERLGLQNNWGLSDVLRGQSLLPDSIQRSTIERLSFLARGTVPSNPAELLDSPRMKGMLEELRRSFSFVVIDSPPVMAVSDAAVLSVASDGVLLVFNGRTTQAAVAQKAVERLDLVRARLLGVVLNAVDLDDPNYSYYSKYTTYYDQLNDDGVEYTNGVGNNASKPDLMRREFLETQLFADDSPILAGNHPEASEDTPSASGPGSSKSFQSDHPTQSLSAASDRYASTQGRNRANTEFRISVEALTKVLTQVIGPIAPEVIREQIAALGEARHAFPESRLDELLKVIEMQITEGERAALRQILARRNAAH